MQVNLCFPTLTNYEGLANAIESASTDTSLLKPTNIVVMDNGGKFKEHFGEVTKVNGCKLTVVVPEKNLGVAGSWNYFLKNYDDHLIISNDDVVFKHDTLQLLVEGSINNPDELFICPNAYWEHYFSMFLLKKRAKDEIGLFDENWFPAYFEDLSYLYRLKLKGYKPFVVENCYYEHVDGGSKTSRRAVDGQKFQEMLNIYISMWGGVPRCETFLTPFNSK